MLKDLWKKRSPQAICTLKPYEWEALANLLQQGYPLQDAMSMIKDDLDLTFYFEQGMDILTLFTCGHKGMFYRHFSFFFQITSLPEAILSALSLEKFQKSIKEKLWKECSYPMLLFLFSCMTLYLFSSFIIPSLMQSFEIKEQQPFLLYGVQILQLLVNLLLGSISVCLVLVILAKRRSSIKFFLLHWLRRTKLPQTYCSYTLAGYYRELILHGISTRHAFLFLQELSVQTLLGVCVKEIQAQLEEGKELSLILQNNEWIDARFVQSWNIGVHTQHMADSLLQYMKRQETMWQESIKHFSRCLQAGAYSFVALMMVLVYQIMLVPLQLLETM